MHPRCLCLEALRQGEVLFFSSSRSSQGPPPLSTLVLCLPAHGEHVKHTSRPVGVRHSHPGKPINAHDSLLLLSTLFILLCVASAPSVQRALGAPVTGSLSLSLSLHVRSPHCLVLVQHSDRSDRCLSLFTQHFENSDGSLRCSRRSFIEHS